MALYDAYAQQAFEGYGTEKHHGHHHHSDMELPRAQGKTVRRQLNACAVCIAIAVPVILFAVASYLTSSELYYKNPNLVYLLVGLMIFFVLVIGAGAAQDHRKMLKSGERSWWSFIFFTSMVAVLLGSCLGYVNYSANTKLYYQYMGLRKIVDVDPGQNQGQQLLDAGEIDFKDGAKVDTTLNMAYHKSRTWCVAPIIAADGSPLASYDFWAVGMDCCSARQGDFTCGTVAEGAAPAGLRVMDSAEIAGYTLAVQQATAAYNIQSSRAIFLYMMETPYTTIKAYLTRGKTLSIVAFIAYLFVQSAFVAYQTWLFGKGARSGYLNHDASRHMFAHLHHAVGAEFLLSSRIACSRVGSMRSM